jgi:hypothetical protein
VATLFFMGRNDANRSGVSWKVWQITRSGRTVTARWGPALVIGRKIRPVGALQSKSWTFKSTREAIEELKLRLEHKLGQGYQSSPRGRYLGVPPAPAPAGEPEEQPSRADSSRRGRAIRTDATVGTTIRRIEQHFDLPRGCVRLVLPNGKEARKAATIARLLREWAR